jgi:hypothetical protein
MLKHSWLHGTQLMLGYFPAKPQASQAVLTASSPFSRNTRKPQISRVV